MTPRSPLTKPFSSTRSAALFLVLIAYIVYLGIAMFFQMDTVLTALLTPFVAALGAMLNWWFSGDPADEQAGPSIELIDRRLKNIGPPADVENRRVQPDRRVTNAGPPVGIADRRRM